MIPAIRESLAADLQFELPVNYRIGAGDTYFSGKMLAKLARILLVARDVGGFDQLDFDKALVRLKQGVTVWLDGSAESQLLYDGTWGGMVVCGCDYHWDELLFPNGTCLNAYPSCPAMTDQGQNFGAGFYNDHHFHYGAVFVFLASCFFAFCLLASCVSACSDECGTCELPSPISC